MTIDIIIAEKNNDFIFYSKDSFKDAFKLVSSYPEDLKSQIDLEVLDDPKEMIEWNKLFDFASPEETQLLINSEVHYNVFGEGTRYWLIKTAPKTLDSEEREYEKILRKGRNGGWAPTLYDLVYTNSNTKNVNYHAVQFVETYTNGLNFIHLTDLHLAQRNDEILGEVLKECRKGVRSRKEIEEKYINFNDNFRKFIHVANELAERGELDFVMITGDIVDFAGHGWEDEISQSENNWKIFIEMVTGLEINKSFRLRSGDKEPDMFNRGIKVAVFTSTGNHDWRLHPYSLLHYVPGRSGACENFGLRETEAENFNYKSFDSSEYPLDERKNLSDELTKESLKRLNLDALDEKWSINSVRVLEGSWLRGLLSPLGITGLMGLGGAVGRFFSFGAALIGLATPVAVKWFAEFHIRKWMDFLIDNPLHAEVKAMHYYFTNINPYFDYAFSIGDNHFILMDTGADVVTIRAGDLMDGKELKDLKKVSIQDNLIGISPDTMAFDDREAYYNWSQIVWLDKVLSTVSLKKQNAKSGRIILGLHSPPVNNDPKCNMDMLLESKTHEYIPEDKCNLTHGTINHFLSQFFFLCQGLRENPDKKSQRVSNDLEKVDLVLSGHVHMDAEFRLGVGYDKEVKENKIRIYHDKYSSNPGQFDEKKPFLVITAACGPHQGKNTGTPYWRSIKIDEKNRIKCFRQENLEDWLLSHPS
ncbi:MAG: metallophosphoesterase [Candidatus Methanoperedens sp.]|nr:metallophosphoesterase [Candidatus Methanoperedens sp.]MCZ7369380.1 metallophosphoesterase [Candidatus Methanoperedens sp.]